MKQKYKIEFTHNGLAQVEFYQAQSPISALDQFHRSMQIVSEIPAADYKVTKLAIVHPANAYKQIPVVESAYDLPQTPTPVLTKKTEGVKPKETDAMGFLATTTGGKLAE